MSFGVVLLRKIFLIFIVVLLMLFFSAKGTQFTRAVNIKKEMKHVWKGHGAVSEIGNVSAMQAAFNR